MTSDHATPPLEALLAHREWVRSLARRLTSNAVDADDLERDAWLAAASSRPRDGVGKCYDIVTATTDEHGFYRLLNVPSGDHFLSVTGGAMGADLRRLDGLVAEPLRDHGTVHARLEELHRGCVT